MSKTTQPTSQPAEPPKAQQPNRQLASLNWTKPTDLNGLKAFTPAVVGQLNKALPRFLAGQGERMVRCLFTCVQTTPKLLDCAPMTLFGGVIQAGQLGLELGGPLGQAYLIPYGTNATFVLGYKGVISLVFRSDMLKTLRPVRVLEGDHFEVHQGTDARIIHIPRKNNRGKVTDYYVTSEIANGGKDFETFSYEEALEFRDRYSSSRTAPTYIQEKMPWYDMREGIGANGFDLMACKTLMKRIGKRLPVSVEFQRAIGLDDAADAGQDQQLSSVVVVDMPEPQPEEDLRQRLETAKNNSDKKPPGHPEADPFASGEIPK